MTRQLDMMQKKTSTRQKKIDKETSFYVGRIATYNADHALNYSKLTLLHMLLQFPQHRAYTRKQLS